MYGMLHARAFNRNNDLIFITRYSSIGELQLRNKQNRRTWLHNNRTHTKLLLVKHVRNRGNGATASNLGQLELYQHDKVASYRRDHLEGGSN